jgi:hypothetical protein
MISHDVASIVHHLVSRVQAVEVENEPYQHFFLTNAFPPDVYAEMRRRLPDRQCYAPLNIKRWKNAAGESTRDRLLLSGGEIDRIRAEDQDFWSTVTTGLTGREFQLAVYDRFRDDIAIRLNCDREQVLQQQAWPTAMLVRDYEEYQLKPHPDGHPRVVTMMFYLADDGSPEDLGTSVYRERSTLSRLLGQRFEEVKRFPFLPNSASAFVVNDNEKRRSLHGREYIEGKNIARDSLIIAWLYKEHEEFGRKHSQKEE